MTTIVQPVPIEQYTPLDQSTPLDQKPPQPTSTGVIGQTPPKTTSDSKIAVVPKSNGRDPVNQTSYSANNSNGLSEVDPDQFTALLASSPKDLHPNSNEQLTTLDADATTASVSPETQIASNNIFDLQRQIGDAVDQSLRNMPPALRAPLELLRNSPPDAMVFGTVADIPGLGKVGVFAIQPTQRNNALLPDLSKPPTIFVSIPSRNIVATYNPENGQVEFGPGAARQVAPQTLLFYNQRTGGQIDGLGPGSASVNFGLINSTLSDPAMNFFIDKISQGVTHIARGLQAAGIIGDVVTGPSGEGVVGAVTVELFRNLIVQQINNRTEWFAGVAWRGADLNSYPNGELTLNLSGSKIRLAQGTEPGGSGLESNSFAIDVPAITSSLGATLTSGTFMPTNNPVARTLGLTLASAYTYAGQSDEVAMAYTVQAFHDGGRARLVDRIMQLVSSNRPNNVTDSAFRAFTRMSFEDAIVAKEAYDLIRSRGDSPDTAWADVMNAYINGYSGLRYSGVANGGRTGGRQALDAMVQFLRSR
jgi:hypothetical protein